jgi:multidrug efflux pump subunit AcrA (membrane-fusion protein)
MNTVYSPRGEFVARILLQTGQPVAAGQAVLQLDTLSLERELEKTRMQLRILDVAAERLADDYLSVYVFGPMEAMIEFRKNSADNATFTQNYVATRIGVSPADVALADAKLQAANVDLLNATDALERKKIDIAGKKKDQEADRAQLNKSSELVRKLIDLCTVLAPQAGRLELQTVEGLFVEKGDVLFTIT